MKWKITEPSFVPSHWKHQVKVIKIPNRISKMVVHNLNDVQWYPLKPLAAVFFWHFSKHRSVRNGNARHFKISLYFIISMHFIVAIGSESFLFRFASVRLIVNQKKEKRKKTKHKWWELKTLHSFLIAKISVFISSLTHQDAVFVCVCVFLCHVLALVLWWQNNVK